MFYFVKFSNSSGQQVVPSIRLLGIRGQMVIVADKLSSYKLLAGQYQRFIALTLHQLNDISLKLAQQVNSLIEGSWTSATTTITPSCVVAATPTPRGI